MKPRIFIGSSVESLIVAEAIQQNLSYNAEITIWSQGLFKLGNTALEDLTNSLASFDFGIFVFNADDIANIRNEKVSVVRDNVIFEMGLFMGKLGKEKVFYLVPQDATDLHFPSDLLGIMPGKYDNKRADGNMQAALGPFCTQMKEKLKDFVYVSLQDLQDESLAAKKIAVEKPPYWEYLLICEILEPKFKKIQDDYVQLESGLFYINTVHYDTLDNVKKWIGECLKDISKLITLFCKLMTEEIQIAIGPDGEPGNVGEIKKVCDGLYTVGIGFLQWEYKVAAAVLPSELKKIVPLISGWSKPLFQNLVIIPVDTRRILREKQEGKTDIKPLQLKLHSPDNIPEVTRILNEYFSR